MNWLVFVRVSGEALEVTLKRSHSNSVEWIGVTGGHFMRLHGVPRGDIVTPD
jgi:hypothetical protein